MSLTSYTCCREGLEVSYGLNSALAARGVIIKEKSFHNLQKSELKKKGAITVGNTKLMLSFSSSVFSLL